MAKWTITNVAVEEWLTDSEREWAACMARQLQENDGAKIKALLNGVGDDPNDICLRGYYAGLLTAIAGLKMEGSLAPRVPS